MKVNEIFEGKDVNLSNIIITDKGNGSFLVSTKESSGPMVTTALYYVIGKYLYNDVKGVKVFKKSGAEMTRWPPTPLNGYVLKFDNPEGAKEKLEKLAADAVDKTEKGLKKAAKWKEEAPARKKADAAHYSTAAKAKKSAEDAKYGKGTSARIKIKQEGGDDGYSYVVRFDGRVIDSGLTRNSAEHVKQKQMIKIAQANLVGDWSPEHKDTFIKRVLLRMKAGDTLVASTLIDNAENMGYKYPEFSAIKKSLGSTRKEIT